MSCIENYSLADTYMPSYRCLERKRSVRQTMNLCNHVNSNSQELFLH